MLVLNQAFFHPRNIVQFIEASTNVLTCNNRDIVVQKEYWLYYYIKEDVTSNLYSLQGRDIDLDIFGFSFLKRTTRHAIEAYLDMFNLCNDPEYIEVMKACANPRNAQPGKYSRYKHKDKFTVQSKVNIAKEMHGADLQWLINVCRDGNSYVHPNVFVDVIGVNEVTKKEAILRELLQVNLRILTEAYLLFVRRFNNGQQPYLNCMGCSGGNCLSCYEREKATFQQLLNSQLFTKILQPPTFL